MQHGRLSTGLLVTGLVALAACAPAVKGPATPQTQVDTRALAREALSRLDRVAAEPYACARGWAESSAGFVVALAEWADAAGLRPGDQVAAVGGAQVTGPEARARAYAQVPNAGPLVLGVNRHGQTLTLALPCRSQPDLFRAERQTLEAASRGDWDGCIVAAREARRLAGFTAYVNLIWEHACTRAKTPSMTSPDGMAFASLSYETARLLLHDSRYVPGGTASVEGRVRQMADDLRQSGFPAYADDLERQLQAALTTLPRIELRWKDNSTNEGGFIVERKIGQTGAYLVLATLPPNTTTYVDTAVQDGVTYCYRVKAFNAAAYSDYTNEGCAQPSSSTSAGGDGGRSGRRGP